MYDDIIISGFGGQGIMLMGQMLAYAGLEEGLNVLWIPSYGPEMRGGSANCTVIISDDEIGSPVISHPRNLILMNQPSVDRFEKTLMPGGLLLYNSSMVNRKPERTDVKLLEVDATNAAHDIGNRRVANIIVLGAFLAANPVVGEDTIKKLIEYQFKKKEELIRINVQAFEKGYELGKEGLKINT